MYTDRVIAASLGKASSASDSVQRFADERIIAAWEQKLQGLVGPWAHSLRFFGVKHFHFKLMLNEIILSYARF